MIGIKLIAVLPAAILLFTAAVTFELFVVPEPVPPKLVFKAAKIIK
jgi:hypothetical protein